MHSKTSIILCIEFNLGKKGRKRKTLADEPEIGFFDVMDFKKENISAIIAKSLFPKETYISIQQFEEMEVELLCKKPFSSPLKRVLAVLYMKGNDISVHWRDETLSQDPTSMEKLQDALYSPRHRHLLDVVFVAK